MGTTSTCLEGCGVDFQDYRWHALRCNHLSYHHYAASSNSPYSQPLSASACRVATTGGNPPRCESREEGRDYRSPALSSEVRLGKSACCHTLRSALALLFCQKSCFFGVVCWAMKRAALWWWMLVLHPPLFFSWWICRIFPFCEINLKLSFFVSQIRRNKN